MPVAVLLLIRPEVPAADHGVDAAGDKCAQGNRRFRAPAGADSGGTGGGRATGGGISAVALPGAGSSDGEKVYVALCAGGRAGADRFGLTAWQRPGGGGFQERTRSGT